MKEKVRSYILYTCERNKESKIWQIKESIIEKYKLYNSCNNIKFGKEKINKQIKDETEFRLLKIIIKLKLK